MYKRYREEHESAKMMEEEKALKQLRRTLVHHARPVPKFDNPFHPQKLVAINLADLCKEFQSPICLGILWKTGTVMECLHHFCRECIDKSMRMGNNECPACRTHCASCRSLRDDPNFDALIAAIYQDMDKYVAEELAFREEEKSRNKQIQASVAQTIQRQTDALGQRHSTKAVATFVRRSRGRKRGRGSRSSRFAELQGSDDDEDANGIVEDRESSSAEECSAAVPTKRRKRWSGPRSSQPSSIDVDGFGDGNDDLELGRESTSASPGFIGTPEMLAWGKGGLRNNFRYGNASGNGKSSRYNRIAKLADHLRSSENNVNKVDVQLIVIPLDKQTTPSMEEPFHCCNPTTSVVSSCKTCGAKVESES